MWVKECDTEILADEIRRSVGVCEGLSYSIAEAIVPSR